MYLLKLDSLERKADGQAIEERIWPGQQSDVMDGSLRREGDRLSDDTTSISGIILHGGCFPIGILNKKEGRPLQRCLATEIQ